MLTVVEEAAVPGNFYFSPLELRPVIRTAKRESKFDLALGLRRAKDKYVADGADLSEDDSAVDDEEEEDNGSEAEATTRATKENKKKNHKNKKNNNGKSKDSTSMSNKINSTIIEHLCSKLRVSFILAILGVIILAACCCALYLRKRIVACFRKCWPKRKKKPTNKALFDVEEGDYPYQSSGASPFKKSNKKKKGATKMIDTGTQDSRTSMAKAREEKPEKVGCSPCCRKKNKKKKKQKS